MSSKQQRMSVSVTRRDFLKIGAAAAALAACSRLLGDITIFRRATTPAASSTESVSVPAFMSTIEAPQPLPPEPPLKQPALAWLAVNRLMFGPRPGDLVHVDEVGVDAFIEEQLSANATDDPDLAARLQALSTLRMSPTDLAELKPRNIQQELQQATLLRAVYGSRQLEEVMVDFWTNHFNIYFQKDTDHFLKTIDDRQVIRPNAMGKFHDLLDASAYSPAMLVYLDNVTNRKGNPNENYARELMELHTIGVNGGYTQTDVTEVARVHGLDGARP